MNSKMMMCEAANFKSRDPESARMGWKGIEFLKLKVQLDLPQFPKHRVTKIWWY